MFSDSAWLQCLRRAVRKQLRKNSWAPSYRRRKLEGVIQEAAILMVQTDLTRSISKLL